ncbi:TPA: GNAT family N-acetyltransferase [Candidatus Galligastranaerophilus intestinavium]|uniref:GNAT family N-acetyltransferase n=1 Tax=Candidatus Galligastranaerophilus intestinavium TaxID=2840836 RepID=A0A9D1FJI8_9BACT|nr:GNAT family N-acetyltransferase [Candidatus Galligastranaerophilus intestinavium]
MYETQVLSQKYFKIFAGVYNDFRLKCATDYKFEIEPLTYEEFIEYFEKKLINCVILLEDDIPTGFLAYSNASKDVIELFLIHILGNENINEKRNSLMEKFMLDTCERRKQALVSYPMLGVQTDYKDNASFFGFKFIELAVMVFDINDKKLIKEIEQLNLYSIPIGYKIVPYSDIYADELAGVILKSFADSSDINFDVRFGSIEGCRDIVDKITKSVYGRFLSHSSKVLLHENRLIGFCLSNVTGEHIGNIPLVGILKEHRGMGLSKLLLKSVVSDVIKLNQSGLVNLSEINASVDLDNLNAVKMYEDSGFIRSYNYPQAYLPRSMDSSLAL